MTAWMNKKTFLVAFLVATWTGSAAAAEWCQITYQFEMRGSGENFDPGPFSRTATACVEDLNDCHNRAKRLAEEDSRQREAPPYVGGRTDLSTISVTELTTDGSCDDPGGPPRAI